MENASYVLGMILGVVIALVALLILWKAKGTSLKGKFDERQELVRGRGYKYAFLTVMILIFLYMTVDMLGITDLMPFAHSSLAIAILFIGVMVYAVYCIKNDAYFGIGQNRRTYCILLGFVVVFNLLSAVMNLRDEPFEGGKVALGPCIQIMCVITFAVVLIALLVKGREDGAEDDDDEDIDDIAKNEGGDAE